MTGRDKTDLDKTGSAPPKDAGKTKKPPPPQSDDDDYEDGDFVSPKRDRTGNDDEPLE